MSRLEYIQLEQIKYVYNGPVSLVNGYKIGDKVNLNKYFQNNKELYRAELFYPFNKVYKILNIRTEKNLYYNGKTGEPSHSLCQLNTEEKELPCIRGDDWFDESWLEKVK